MVWCNFTGRTETSRVKSLHAQLSVVLLAFPRLLLPVELIEKKIAFFLEQQRSSYYHGHDHHAGKISSQYKDKISLDSRSLNVVSFRRKKMEVDTYIYFKKNFFVSFFYCFKEME